MNISDFLRKLLPSFGKDRIIEDCRITRGELEETVKPLYTQAATFFKSWTFKSARLKDRITTFKDVVKGGGNIVVTIERGIEPMLQNLNDVEELIKQCYGDEVVAAGMTYKKTQLLHFVTSLQFVSRYLIDFIDYIYVNETEEYKESGTTLEEAFTPAQIQYIEDNFMTFCLAFKLVTTNPAEVKKKLSEVPDIVVTQDNATTLPTTVGMAKLDPLQQSFIGTWSPLYWFGLRVAEWQAERYAKAKADLRKVQLRKLNLEQVSKGKPDPKVQKELQYLEERAKDLAYRIKKMEE